jgi:alkylhydroperoxidase/carboxymuconolactone decarboxylase family protein YurZ
LDQVVLASASAVLVLLYGLMCVEMHITARHFHGAAESFIAVIAGLAVFQAPVTLFMLRVLK